MSDNSKGLIVLSGASSGIGLAMTKTLLLEGYSVIGLDKSFENVEIKDKNFKPIVLDLSDLDKLPDSLTEILAGINQPIRALVNNAGLGRMAFVEQLSIADMKMVMEVNFLSHAIITKCFLPVLKQQKNLVDIVFTASEASMRGARQGSVYCASKFAIRGFAQALREECAKSSVRVSVLNPGAVRTAFFNELHFEPGSDPENAIEPEDVAEVILTILDARPGTVIDEINLSPQKQVWKKKN